MAMIPEQDILGDLAAAMADHPLDGDEAAGARLLDDLGLAAPVERPPAGPTHLCLNLAQACNLCCPYCYGGAGEYGKPGLMSREVAVAAIDMLFERGGPGDYRITLFGGEPLLNFEVLAAALEHAQSRAAQVERNVGFELSTNGTLITPEIADFLRRHQVEMVVSIEGDRRAHDRVRSCGHDGTYDVVLERLAPWLEARDQRLAAVATLTHLDPDVERHVTHILGLGFRQVSARPVATADPEFALTRDDWETLKAGASALALRFLAAAEQGELLGWEGMLRPVRLLWRGAARGYRCGAGGELLAVDAEGRLYPCHRFIGREQFIWGDVWHGPDAALREAFLEAAWVDRRSECAGCWARYLCGGRCYQVEALSVDGPEQAEGRCRLARRGIALAIQVHARLRERFGEHWLARLLLSQELGRRGHGR